MLNHTGTYALIFSASQERQIKVGKLGTLQLNPGFYIYVGSAFGPGGLKARIAHHCQKPRRRHWHMDYLGHRLDLIEVWYTCDPARREHQWAETMTNAAGVSVPLTGFGSSDCRCRAHLLFSKSKPAIITFRRQMNASVKNHSTIFKKAYR